MSAFLISFLVNLEEYLTLLLAVLVTVVPVLEPRSQRASRLNRVYHALVNTVRLPPLNCKLLDLSLNAGDTQHCRLSDQVLASDIWLSE